jgi:hypothetical protein
MDGSKAMMTGTFWGMGRKGDGAALDRIYEISYLFVFKGPTSNKA